MSDDAPDPMPEPTPESIPDPGPLGPALAIVDLYTASAEASVAALAELHEAVAAGQLEVLFLGPPLRVQIPLEVAVSVIDIVPHGRVRIVQWPFTQPLRSSRKA